MRVCAYALHETAVKGKHKINTDVQKERLLLYFK